jgi:hypothetical protein
MSMSLVPDHSSIRLSSELRSTDTAAPSCGIVGTSPALRQVMEQVEAVAFTEATVLIRGESGPEPHPNFIEVLCGAAVGGGSGEVARAGENVVRPDSEQPLIGR